MFKKIALILVLVLVIGALLIAAFWDEIFQPRISDATKQLISQACVEQRIGTLNWDAKDREPGSVRYYGNFEGYEVFFYCPENVDLEKSGSIRKIGNKEFYRPFAGCEIYAYKDGKIYNAADVSFSEASVQKMLKQHSRYDNRWYIKGDFDNLIYPL